VKYNLTTSKVCSKNLAHAFAPTAGLALCNLMVITTKMPVQLQTIQKNGIVQQSARTFLRSNRKFLDGRTESKIWSVNWETTWEAASMIKPNANN